MPIPKQNTNMAGEAVGFLTDAFRNQVAIPALTSICAAEVQVLENAIWEMLGGRSLVPITVTNSQGQQVTVGPLSQYALPQTNPVIDTLGQIVGAPPRGGLSDAQYLAIVYLKIACNRSGGRTTDWSNIAAVLLQTSGGPVEYFEGPEAEFYLFIGDMTLPPSIVVQVLDGAVGNGIGAQLGYTMWPDGNDFEFDDANNPTTTGEAGFADAAMSDPAPGGVLASVAVIA